MKLIYSYLFRILIFLQFDTQLLRSRLKNISYRRCNNLRIFLVYILKTTLNLLARNQQLHAIFYVYINLAIWCLILVTGANKL